VREVSLLLADAVETRAGGNPLFIQRLARWLSARGLVEIVGGTASLSFEAASDPAGSLPPDLETLVLAEIDQLPAPMREVLRALSVLGHESGAELAFRLCELCGVARETTADALEHLARVGLLMAAGGDEPVYLFARVSDREVIYSGLPVEQRRALHARVAAVLAQRAGTGLAEPALHYDAADDHPNASSTCLAAARLAQRRGAFSDALRLHRAAARHLEAMGGDATECRVAEVECLSALAAWAEARELAVKLAKKVRDPLARLRAHIAAARCASCEGNPELAAELTEQARAEIPEDAPPALRASLMMTCAQHRFSLGQLREALDELSAARMMATEELAPLIEGMLSSVLAELGRTREAVSWAESAFDLAEKQRHRGQQALALTYLGRALYAAGDLDGAREKHLQAQRLYTGLHQPMDAASAALHVAEVALAQAMPAKALEQLEAVLETSRHFSAGPVEAAALCGIGRARWLLRDTRRAIHALEQAIELAETTLAHHAAVCGRAYLAEALWESERERARKLLDEAKRLASARGLSVELQEVRQVERRLTGT
jgi:tetratricopeptide (TPR) repeat protein